MVSPFPVFDHIWAPSAAVGHQIFNFALRRPLIELISVGPNNNPTLLRTFLFATKVELKR